MSGVSDGMGDQNYEEKMCGQGSIGIGKAEYCAVNNSCFDTFFGQESGFVSQRNACCAAK